MTAMKTYDMDVRVGSIVVPCEVTFVVYPAQPMYDDCPAEPAFVEILQIFHRGKSVTDDVDNKEFSRLLDELNEVF